MPLYVPTRRTFALAPHATANRPQDTSEPTTVRFISLSPRLPLGTGCWESTQALCPDGDLDVVHRRAGRARVSLGRIRDRLLTEYRPRRLSGLGEHSGRPVPERTVEQLDDLQHG